ncbi:hypothetical protein GLOIN_2v1487802 [Rhizophagus clarus]|uniref:Uncharacterized protein n=1 Tax=Rhizophagus clarus TaxID=94130 RepID=A0A8H3KRI1_9GLOM|nr:hypothetical protein GLOIN_2v1487802 [Rhizophagus clarus]
MPNCTYCNKVFNDRQTLEETTFINDDEIIDNNKDINIYFLIESQSEEDNNAEVNLSDDESMTESSDKDSIISNLSYETNVDINEYNEYDALYSGMLDGPKDIYQEFLSKEYAEFMHIITKFHVQDFLANVFIKFFNKYSNCKDKPLLSISQIGIEYKFEYRTVLDGIHQILMNKDIIKDFIFKSVKDTPNKCQYIDMYDSDWWRNVEKNLPIGAYVMPIINFKWFYPFLALIISDWPEACVMDAIYESSNSSHPCHFCLVDRNTLNNIHIKKEDIIICNEHDTKNILCQGNGALCIPDRMHHADLDLFQYQLRFTVELLNLKYGSNSIKILEE